MAAEIAGQGHAHRCDMCGRPLDLHERAAGDTCHTLRCRAAKTVRVRDEQRRAREANEAAAAAACFDTLEGEQGPAGASLIGVVPAFDRPLVAQDPERVEQLRLSLENAVHGIADLTSLPAEPEFGRHEAPQAAGILGTACALCGGVCCMHGSTHAFLFAEELAVRLARAPSLTARGIVDAYIAALPERSYEGSCVFHGERGCSLERSARSRICNEYRCGGLTGLAAALEMQRPDRVNIASVRDGRVHRAITVYTRPG